MVSKTSIPAVGKETMDRGAASGTSDTRNERLGQALRDNLKRRKAQARARLEAARSDESSTGPSRDAEGEP